MASNLRFDNCVIDSTTVTTAEFVSGSGRIVLAGDDFAVTTSDGKIHNHRRQVTPRAEVELYGDKSTLESAVGLGDVCTFKRSSDTVKSFTGVVTARYDENAGTTRVTVTGNPAAS